MSEPNDPTRNPEWIGAQEAKIATLQRRVEELEEERQGFLAFLAILPADQRENYINIRQDLNLRTALASTAAASAESVVNNDAQSENTMSEGADPCFPVEEPLPDEDVGRVENLLEDDAHGPWPHPQVPRAVHINIDDWVANDCEIDVEDREFAEARRQYFIRKNEYYQSRIVPLLGTFWHTARNGKSIEAVRAFNDKLLQPVHPSNRFLIAKDEDFLPFLDNTLSNGINNLRNHVPVPLCNTKHKFVDRAFLKKWRLPNPFLKDYVDYWVEHRDIDDPSFGLRTNYLNQLDGAGNLLYPVFFHCDEQEGNVNAFRSCRTASCCFFFCYMDRNPADEGVLLECQRCGMCDGGHPTEACSTFTDLWHRAMAFFLRKRCWICCGKFGSRDHGFGKQCPRLGHTFCRFCEKGDHHSALCQCNSALNHIGTVMAIAKYFEYFRRLGPIAEDQTFAKNAKTAESLFVDYVSHNFGTGLRNDQLSETSMWYKGNLRYRVGSSFGIRDEIYKGVEWMMASLDMFVSLGKEYVFERWPVDTLNKYHIRCAGVVHGDFHNLLAAEHGAAIGVNPWDANYKVPRKDQLSVREEFTKILDNDFLETRHHMDLRPEFRRELPDPEEVAELKRFDCFLQSRVWEQENLRMWNIVQSEDTPVDLDQGGPFGNLFNEGNTAEEKLFHRFFTWIMEPQTDKPIWIKPGWVKANARPFDYDNFNAYQVLVYVKARLEKKFDIPSWPTSAERDVFFWTFCILYERFTKQEGEHKFPLLK